MTIYTHGMYRLYNYTYVSLHAIGLPCHVTLLNACLCLCVTHMLHVHAVNISL